jgi:predicted HicB family RNase H-like nuclease
MDSKKFVVSPDATVSDIDLDEEEFTLPDGTRLTEERARQIAAVSEQRRANLVPGRKSLSGGSTHSPVIQVRVPEALREELRQVADERGVSVSKLARDILEESLHERRAS